MKNRREFLIGSLAFSAGLLSCCKQSILRDNNDLKLKQRIAERRSKESGKTVTVDEVSCYGCKQKGKQCGIIDCAKGRNIDSCSLCVDLEKCSQNYWKDFPGVRTRALEIQKIVMKNNKT